MNLHYFGQHISSCIRRIVRKVRVTEPKEPVQRRYVDYRPASILNRVGCHILRTQEVTLEIRIHYLVPDFFCSIHGRLDVMNLDSGVVHEDIDFLVPANP